MLKGIDISNWQSDIKLSRLTNDIDFCIVKATEGIGYKDPCLDDFWLQAKDCGLLYGFYHFARENDPEKEANWFYTQAVDMIGHGIPVLDYETDNNDNCEWCERFIDAFYDLAGVYPVLYISAYRVPQYDGSWIPEKCGLWIAGYPYPAESFDDEEMPYSIGSWEFAAMWQFTSSLQLDGYNGNLDGDYAYMDTLAWRKYAGADESKPAPKPQKSYIELAKEIMRDEWSTGDERYERLKAAGYDPDKAQDIINEYYDLANDIWLGNWGNGWNRKNALEGAGYDYELAQMCVDALEGEF